MEKKKESKPAWNFSAFESIKDAFDDLTPDYGEKGVLGSIGAFLAIQLTPEQLKNLKKMVRDAASNAEHNDSTVLEEIRKLCAGKPMAIDLSWTPIVPAVNNVEGLSKSLGETSTNGAKTKGSGGGRRRKLA